MSRTVYVVLHSEEYARDRWPSLGGGRGPCPGRRAGAPSAPRSGPSCRGPCGSVRPGAVSVTVATGARGVFPTGPGSGTVPVSRTLNVHTPWQHHGVGRPRGTTGAGGMCTRGSSERSRRLSVALRLMNLARYLASRHYGASYVQLEREFEVCQRQLRRDLDALETMGFRVEAWDAEDGIRRFKLARLPDWMSEFLASGGAPSEDGRAGDPTSTSSSVGADSPDIPLCA